MNTHDVLTGLYSRRYFNATVDKFEEQKLTPVAVIMGDVNNLKVINDIFGHTYGDELLTTAGNILKSAAKPHYIIGRCGGDEFNILIPGGTEAEAIEFCQKVQDACHTQKISGFKPSIALGYSIRTSDVQTLTAAMDFAETKMYSDKAALKQRQDILGDIEKIICKKGFMTTETIRLCINTAKAFAEYLDLGKIDTDNIVLLSRIIDFGVVTYSEQDFSFIDNTDILCNHIETGYRIAKLTDKTYHLADAIYQSHEWWNGLGTPMHKKGTEINFYARIASIIVYYAQVISPAPYGYDKDIPSAIKLIKKYSGKRFDPEYAEKFIAFAEEYLLQQNND